MPEDTLTDRETLIIQLHYADGWSLRRIARGIGVDDKSVRRSHTSALLHLRAYSAKDGGPFEIPTSALRTLLGEERE